MTAAATPLLAPEQAQWVQGALSILVGTCSAQGRPHVARAVGCFVAPDRSRVTLLLQASTAEHSLDDVAATGRLAVVFCDPVSNRSLQIKGRCEGAAPAGPSSTELARLWVQGFAHRLRGSVPPWWTPEAVDSAFLTGLPGDLVCVALAPQAIFDQTPGPDAGRALAAAG